LEKDTTAPTALASGVPTGMSSVTSIDAKVTATDPSDIVGYLFKLGSTATTDCTVSSGYSVQKPMSAHIISSLSSFPEGAMTLCLLGVDAIGNTQTFASATQLNWTKVLPNPNDTTAPVATLSGAPTGTNNAKTLNVAVSAVVASDIATYRYKLGATAAINCADITGYSTSQPGATPITDSIAAIADGSITLCVVAADAIPNEQPVSAATTATWIKDTQAPTAIIAGSPVGTNNVSSLNVTVSSSAIDFASYLYKVGASATTDCTSSTNYTSQASLAVISDSLSSIADGPIKLCVLAVDSLGNTQSYASATSVVWTKDTTAPSIILTNAPVAVNKATSIDVTVTSPNNDFAGYKYKLGFATTTDCSLNTNYVTVNSTSTHITASIAGYADGDFRICVLGIDSLGNTQALNAATIANWTKDTTAPIAIFNNAQQERQPTQL